MQEFLDIYLWKSSLVRNILKCLRSSPKATMAFHLPGGPGIPDLPGWPRWPFRPSKHLGPGAPGGPGNPFRPKQ